LFDADEAGQAAVLRGFEPLLQAGLQVKVLVLPDAKDPDEYLQKHSKEELGGLLDKAPDFFRWRAASLRKKLQGLPAEEKVRALAGMVPVILQVPDEAVIQAACAAIESELGLDNRDMLAIVNAQRKKGPANRPAARPEENAAPVPKENGTDFQIEADFLALLTEENGAFVPWAQKELSPEVFLDEKLGKLFEEVQSGTMTWKDLAAAPELEPSFLKIESRTEKRMRETMLLELAVALKKRFLKRQMDSIKTRQVEAEKAGETEKVLQLGQQIVVLKQQYSQGVEPK
jgi:DNA primase